MNKIFKTTILTLLLIMNFSFSGGDRLFYGQKLDKIMSSNIILSKNTFRNPDDIKDNTLDVLKSFVSYIDSEENFYNLQVEAFSDEVIKKIVTKLTEISNLELSTIILEESDSEEEEEEEEEEEKKVKETRKNLGIKITNYFANKLLETEDSDLAEDKKKLKQKLKEMQINSKKTPNLVSELRNTQIEEWVDNYINEVLNENYQDDELTRERPEQILRLTLNGYLEYNIGEEFNDNSISYDKVSRKFVEGLDNESKELNPKIDEANKQFENSKKEFEQSLKKEFDINARIQILAKSSSNGMPGEIKSESIMSYVFDRFLVLILNKDFYTKYHDLQILDKLLKNNKVFMETREIQKVLESFYEVCAFNCNFIDKSTRELFPYIKNYNNQMLGYMTNIINDSQSLNITFSPFMDDYNEYDEDISFIGEKIPSSNPNLVSIRTELDKTINDKINTFFNSLVFYINTCNLSVLDKFLRYNEKDLNLFYTKNKDKIDTYLQNDFFNQINYQIIDNNSINSNSNFIIDTINSLNRNSIELSISKVLIAKFPPLSLSLSNDLKTKLKDTNKEFFHYIIFYINTSNFAHLNQFLSNYTKKDSDRNYEKNRDKFDKYFQNEFFNKIESSVIANNPNLILKEIDFLNRNSMELAIAKVLTVKFWDYIINKIVFYINTSNFKGLNSFLSVYNKEDLNLFYTNNKNGINKYLENEFSNRIFSNNTYAIQQIINSLNHNYMELAIGRLLINIVPTNDKHKRNRDTQTDILPNNKQAKYN